VMEDSAGSLTAALSADLQYVVDRSRGNVLRLWSTATGARLWNLPPGGTYVPSFSADSREVILCGEGTVRGCRVSDGAVVWSTPIPGAQLGTSAPSPDGRLLACRTSAMTIHLLDMQTRQILCRLEHPDPAALSHLFWSEDSTMLGACTGRHSVNVWHLRLLRKELRGLGLDWNHPALPEKPESTPIARVITEPETP
jgi:hypothetical protein